jgi:hypothetical protein
MKYMDIDCYERGCACASSNRVAGEDSEVVEVVKLRESQEPVGWWNEERRIHWLDAVLETKEDGWDTPLYTAPRELSDDEIITRYRELMARCSV